MLPSSGSELLYMELNKRIDVNEYNIKLILNDTDVDIIEEDKKNVLWQHGHFDQFSSRNLGIKEYSDKLDCAVFVSNYQLSMYWKNRPFIPLDKSYVIENAINNIEYKEKEQGKIKLIYTSTPWRGLKVLLDVMEKIENKNVELHVYSSTIIYGDDFDKDNKHLYEDLFERAKNMENVIYHGYATNEDVIKALQECHIFAYPCIWEETSCLGLIEAGAAGCKIVTTNLGAIPETSCGWGVSVPVQYAQETLVDKYLELLNNSIDNYWDEYETGIFKEQSDFFNKQYSWNKQILKWEKLFKSI